MIYQISDFHAQMRVILADLKSIQDLENGIGSLLSMVKPITLFIGYSFQYYI